MNAPIGILPWPPAPRGPSCGPGEVHVLAAALQVARKRREEFSATLSAEEKERAARFKFDLHRHRFIAGRGTLRAVLGQLLGLRPQEIEFKYSAESKPALSGKGGQSGIHFNLAHSEDLALIAITRVAAIGVDVEHIRPMPDAEDLVARFFSARESAQFRTLPSEARPGAFFNLWTRKEALLKATGQGIAGGLNRVEVSFFAGEPARLLAVDADAEKAAEWSLEALAPAPGFVGAVAVQSTGVKARCWRWD